MNEKERKKEMKINGASYQLVSTRKQRESKANPRSSSSSSKRRHHLLRLGTQPPAPLPSPPPAAGDLERTRPPRIRVSQTNATERMRDLARRHPTARRI
jgi:hypothetical protein